MKRIKHSYVSSPQVPFAMFGIETCPGWRPIAQKVIDAILEYNENAPQDSTIFIDQVKEKFAHLEIYLTYENVPEDVVTKINQMVNEAQKEADMTCEFCGAKENVGMQVSGWYNVICEDCAKKRVKGSPYYKEFGLKWRRFSDGSLYSITNDSISEVVDTKKQKNE